MNVILVAVLLSGGLADPPRLQDEEMRKRIMEQGDDMRLEPVEVQIKLTSATLWTNYDDELGLETQDGTLVEIQMRFDKAYYYKFVGSFIQTETDDLADNEDVDVTTIGFGFGMDALLSGLDLFAVDLGFGIGWTRYDSDVDTDSAWYYQVELVTHIQPFDLVTFRVGLQYDVVETNFRNSGEEANSRQNLSVFLGVEINW